MIRLILVLMALTFTLPAFAQGGGGADRPSRTSGEDMSGDLTPVQLAFMEARRRLYCLAMPWNCAVEISDRPRRRYGGHCGDVYRTVEEANRNCPAGAHIQQLFLRSEFTCHCYGSVSRDI